MSKDHKEELIMGLKRRTEELEVQLKGMQKVNEDLKKNEATSELKIKSINEMHSQKIKTLLKSIQNLKKEVQKEKLEKKDNVRAQKIEKLTADIGLQEMAINALRKLVGSEDRCDQAIKVELEKGPKRIRVASREELKMEINKYKNMTLRMQQELQKHGIQQPTGMKVDLAAGLGYKEEKVLEEKNSNFDLMGDLGDKSIGVPAGEYFEDRERLEGAVAGMNMELMKKNEKMLELLDEIEEIKIQVYARDKSIELQQKQIEELLEELREAKSLSSEARMLANRNVILEEENIKIRKEMDEKYSAQDSKQLEQKEMDLENRTLVDQLRNLQKKLDQEVIEGKQYRTKVQQEKAQATNEQLALKTELDNLKKDFAAVKKTNDEYKNRMDVVDGQVKGVVSQKDEDLDAYRTKMHELQLLINQKDKQIDELQQKTIDLSQEVDAKKYEVEYYLDQVQDLKDQLVQAASTTAKGTGAEKGEKDQAGELARMKQKLREQARRELEMTEEIERLQNQSQVDKQNQAIKSLLDRDQKAKSKPKQEL